MKLNAKLIASITSFVLLASSLSSCQLFGGGLGGQLTPPPSVNGGQGSDNQNKPVYPNNPGDNNQQDDPTTPQAPVQTTEPSTVLTPEEEAEMARYGYIPAISNVMPIVHINTSDGNNEWVTKYGKNDKVAGNIDYVDATINVSGCAKEHEMDNVEAEVKVRGNATLNYEKKPIRIKFSSKKNLLGLHDGEKYKNWVLLADYKDLSLSNNTAAFFLGNLILGSDGYYCTDFRNVEVYINGQYWGVYLLVEQQEVKDNRSSVPEVDDDYEGTDIGYFFEFDGYYNEEGTSYLDGGEGDPTFTMNHRGLQGRNIGYTVKSDLYTKDQLNFLKTYLENSFYIAYEASRGNYYKFDENYNVVSDSSATNVKDVIGAVIDLQSLVDIYILNEIACDLDVDWSSFYLSLDMSAEGDKKIIFEAPWDWDSCFGLRFDVDAAVPNAQGIYAATRNPWFRLVTGQDWFWEMVREKWSEMKRYDVQKRTVNLIRDQKVIYADCYVRNNQRWPNRVIGGNGEVNSTLNSYRDINTAQGLAADFLINWLNLRFTYLDSQWCLAGDDPYVQSKESSVSRPANATAYRFEAEDAILTDFRSDSPIRSNKYFASGGAYVSDMHKGSTLTFNFDVQKSTTIYLYVSVAKRADAFDFNSCFTVTVNGKKLNIPSREIPAVEQGEDEWHSFAFIRLSTVLVGAGENTVSITAVNDTTNIDYIEIYSSEKVG
jgi:hypothetical protein